MPIAKIRPYIPPILPLQLDWESLIPLIGAANRALASFDGVLYGMPNAELLLSPLTTQEAVLSSRIEVTQATFGEVLKFEGGRRAGAGIASIGHPGDFKLPHLSPSCRSGIAHTARQFEPVGGTAQRSTG